MKRRLLKVAALLVLGAILNVAVAWGCAAYMLRANEASVLACYLEAVLETHSRSRWESETTADGRTIIRHINVQPVDLAKGDFATTGLCLEVTAYRAGGFSVAYAAGWPAQALETRCETGKVLELSAEEKALQLRTPVALGFAINTIFYAAILWLLFAAPGFIRKHRRIKRGLCPACAYPVGSNERCTECGAQVCMPTHDPPGRAGG